MIILNLLKIHLKQSRMTIWLNFRQNQFLNILSFISYFSIQKYKKVNFWLFCEINFWNQVSFMIFILFFASFSYSNFEYLLYCQSSYELRIEKDSSSLWCPKLGILAFKIAIIQLLSNIDALLLCILWWKISIFNIFSVNNFRWHSLLNSL